MRRAILGIVVFALLLSSAVAHAQQTLVGKYEGGFQFHSPAASGLVYIPAGLEISRAADGKVAGTFEIFRYQCRDRYAVEGTYQDNKLSLQIAKGSIMDCGGGVLTLVAEGSKLSGRLGASEIELSRK